MKFCGFVCLLLLGSLIETTLACYPRCTCCWEASEVYGSYDCRDGQPPAGCIPVADFQNDDSPCKKCSCCAKIETPNGLVVHDIIQYKCVDGPPAECTNIGIRECLANNCPCCDKSADPPRIAQYACGDVHPEHCSTDHDDIKNCPCVCYRCREGAPAEEVPYPCDSEVLPQGCIPDPRECGPDGISGPQLLQIVPPSGTETHCDHEFMGDSFVTNNGGRPFTKFEISVQSVDGTGSCTVSASGSMGVEWTLPLSDFEVGDGIYAVGCNCFDENNELHGEIMEVRIACTGLMYFHQGLCVDPETRCSDRDTCGDCNKAGCCWHTDCTCKPYCSLVPPFAVPFCETDPAATCCEDDSTSQTDTCRQYDGQCGACEDAGCCYHSDCSCQDRCIWEPPKLWSFPTGSCDEHDPHPQCCVDEHCGIFRSDGIYIGKDSITVKDPHVTPTNHIKSGNLEYSCLSQDCDDFCEPSVSVGVEGNRVVSATLDCVCCGCDDGGGEPTDTPSPTPTPEPRNCCEEGAQVITSATTSGASPLPCWKTVNDECNTNVVDSNAFSDCYCCELAKYDFANGGCVCHDDCLCGGTQFPGGCSQKYLECCGTRGCVFNENQRWKGSQDVGTEKAVSVADCCSKCQRDPNCLHWNFNYVNLACNKYSAAAATGKRALDGWYSSTAASGMLVGA